MTAHAMTGHWATPYIGAPWVEREAECWHLCTRVWAEVFGWTVDASPFAGNDPRAARRLFEDHTERGNWEPVAEPADGDAVLMARGARTCHVGVWVAPGAILHAVPVAGGLCTPANRLSGLGYRITGFYRRRG